MFVRWVSSQPQERYRLSFRKVCSVSSVSVRKQRKRGKRCQVFCGLKVCRVRATQHTPGQQCFQPRNPALLRGLQEPSRVPSTASGLGGLLESCRCPGSSHYQFPARLISHPICCEYSPGVVQMCSMISSLAWWQFTKGPTTDRFQERSGNECPKSSETCLPSALWLFSLSALEFLLRGHDSSLPPPLHWMRCRPGEMKYEAFVQRDQVSGQTNEHCLSGVHPGKDQWSSCVNGPLFSTLKQRCPGEGSSYSSCI